jgi:uncharacterized membrane protein
MMMKKSLDWGQIISLILVAMFLGFAILGLVDNYQHKNDTGTRILWIILITLLTGVFIYALFITIEQFKARIRWHKRQKLLSQELKDMDMFQIDKPDIV